ncbi:hypothetical protein M8542_41280 [Amycolatopsis sp. OK19-0408]|uniref:Uncharacterized protein n=1 Tax=Amycolatopsis iheyensis TaxID=2945988 RepID=A0A9X2NJZ3_9PSEU|nr:hypothetical protein [Amycolatopsis iheyensis]MCR6489268.1 hypothetical protein [Amycolatopsis iheyensis]
MFVLDGPRCLVRGALRVITGTVQAFESLPRVAAALDDVHASLRRLREDDLNRESPRTG